jgi:hypothetical protein
LGAALQADGETRSRICGLKHQKEKRSMDHFAGLDVSVKETSVCIVDDVGKIVREVKVASEPEALLAVLKNPGYPFKRIGLEAGPLSQWLYGLHPVYSRAHSASRRTECQDQIPLSSLSPIIVSIMQELVPFLSAGTEAGRGICLMVTTMSRAILPAQPAS